MEEEINEYTAIRTALTITADDFFDVDGTDDGGLTFLSHKLKASELVLYVNNNVSNIYSANGTLSGDRTITGAGNFLKLYGGNQIVEMNNLIDDYGFYVNDSLAVDMASLIFDQFTDSGALSIKDSSGVFFSANDAIINSRDGYSIGTDLYLSNGGENSNVYVGRLAGQNATIAAQFNVAIGLNALQDNISSNGNIAIGVNALSNYTGQLNIGIGSNSLQTLTTGQGNVGIGDNALNGIITQQRNTSLGLSAGRGNIGDDNVFIGNGSGFIFPAVNISRSIGLGKQAIPIRSNQALIGGFGAGITELYIGHGVERNFSAASLKISTSDILGLDDVDNNSNITIAGGRGTGTGAGAEIIFSTASSGISGGTMNPLIERLRITSQGDIGVNKSNPTARFEVIGKGTTSGTDTFNFKNSAGSSILFGRDDGVITMNNIPTSPIGLPSRSLWDDAGTVKITA